MSWIWQCPAAETGAVSAIVVEIPWTDQTNRFYIANRPPLLPSRLIKLPIGKIRPEGWIRRQLELMAEGFSGRLEEISQWCKFDGSAWASPTGDGRFGWEELPYWLRGFTDLGYVLQDPRIIRDAQRWINAILASQRPSGYFGPENNLQPLDIWPNMLALYAMRSHYEATGDPRVLTFMTRYFRWLATVPLEKLLPGSWQKVRGGDNLDSLFWLYNHTGESLLLDLSKINHERTGDWTGGIPTWHGVNLAQGFREPAEFYQQTHDSRFLAATLRNFETIMSTYGQVAGGMYGADENARPGFTGPRQGAETCTMAEMMFSDEILLGITGDRTWADRCEEIAANSLPASMTPDLKGLHYLTSPNLIQLDRMNKAPMVENEGDMFSFNPHDYRCCQHNVAFGWPYFAEHLWMATADNGLAVALYAPSRLTARVGGGTEVRIVETTDYPFDEHVTFSLACSNVVRFPLLLRLPEWCEHPRLSVNNQPVTVPPASRGWLRLERSWKDGDRVRFDMPMAIRLKLWEKNHHAVSVSRGPLTYSLKIGERWQRSGGTDRWPAFEVFPTTAWNYGLILDSKDPTRSFEVVKSKKKLSSQPFTPENAPIQLRAKARRIPGWTQEPNGFVGQIPNSPLRSDQPEEQITLIPMGCARLRISMFPQLAE